MQIKPLKQIYLLYDVWFYNFIMRKIMQRGRIVLLRYIYIVDLL